MTTSAERRCARRSRRARYAWSRRTSRQETHNVAARLRQPSVRARSHSVVAPTLTVVACQAPWRTEQRCSPVSPRLSRSIRPEPGGRANCSAGGTMPTGPARCGSGWSSAASRRRPGPTSPPCASRSVTCRWRSPRRPSTGRPRRRCRWPGTRPAAAAPRTPMPRRPRGWRPSGTCPSCPTCPATGGRRTADETAQFASVGRRRAPELVESPSAGRRRAPETGEAPAVGRRRAPEGAPAVAAAGRGRPAPRPGRPRPCTARPTPGWSRSSSETPRPPSARRRRATDAWTAPEGAEGDLLTRPMRLTDQVRAVAPSPPGRVAPASEHVLLDVVPVRVRRRPRCAVASAAPSGAVERRPCGLDRRAPVAGVRARSSARRPRRVV